MLEKRQTARHGKLATCRVLFRTEARPLGEQQDPDRRGKVQQLVQLPGKVVLILEKNIDTKSGCYFDQK